jgi:hypothetical protein
MLQQELLVVTKRTMENILTLVSQFSLLGD